VSNRDKAQVLDAGRKQLVIEKREWDRMVAIMQAMLSEPS